MLRCSGLSLFVLTCLYVMLQLHLNTTRAIHERDAAMIEHDIKQVDSDTKQASAVTEETHRDIDGTKQASAVIQRTDNEIYKQALEFMAGDDDEEDYEPVDNYRYSLKYAFELWLEGEAIWWCLGNFMNDFWVYFPLERQALIDDEIVLPSEMTPEQQKWAVFFAASAEHLAHKYGLSVPSWTQKEQYKSLEDTWYFQEACLRLEDIREYEEETTPEEYKARKIICGKRVWYNKKERIPGTEPQTERIA